jgi:hypothetical protein
MLLYERRIESSLNRAMKELKRFQVVRRVEWQETAKQKNKLFFKDPFLAEAATGFSSAENHGDLKKQSQFMPDLMSVMPFMTSDYGDIPADETGENKANRNQFDAPEPATGMGEREKLVTAATG